MGNSPCFRGLVPAPKLRTGYWKFRGLGAPMRMMCVYKGVTWEDEQFEVKQKRGGGWASQEWEKDVRPQLKATNPLVQLPYVVNDSTGEVVSQSNAVYLYLGRVLGLDGKLSGEKLANEQILFHIYSIFMECSYMVYPFKANKDEAGFLEGLDDYFNKELKRSYEKLEEWLKHRDSTYFIGSSLCTADFHAWELLDQHEAMARRYDRPSPLQSFGRLRTFYEKVRREPRLQPYFESENYKLPINNKMAFFT